MHPTGTAATGPLYCGNKAKTEVEGRPVCGVHKKGCAGITWRGERGRYPEGIGGDWKFARGEFR